MDVATSDPSMKSLAWGSPAHAAIIRHTVLFVWLVQLIATPVERLTAFSFSLFEGFGLGRLVLSLPFTAAIAQDTFLLVVVRGLTITALVASMFSRSFVVIATAISFVGVVFVDALLKGVGGFANHAQAVPLLLLTLVAIFATSQSFPVTDVFRQGGSRMEPQSRHDRLFVALAAVIVVLPYTFVGIQRLTDGGFAMFSDTVLLEYFAAATRSFSAYPEWFNPVHYQVLFNLGFVLTTVLEATSVCLLWSRSFRIVWLAGMAIFHLSTLFLMNVFFWENLLVVLSIFGPFTVNDLATDVRDDFH